MRSPLILNFPVFGDYVIHIEFAQHLHKAMSKYPSCEGGEEFCEDHCDGITVDTHEMTFIFLKPRVSVGTIAHEAWHGVHNMLKTVGVDLDSETVAYHLGYLVNKIMKFKGRK